MLDSPFAVVGLTASDKPLSIANEWLWSRDHMDSREGLGRNSVKKAVRVPARNWGRQSGSAGQGQLKT